GGNHVIEATDPPPVLPGEDGLPDAGGGRVERGPAAPGAPGRHVGRVPVQVVRQVARRAAERGRAATDAGAPRRGGGMSAGAIGEVVVVVAVLVAATAADRMWRRTVTAAPDEASTGDLEELAGNLGGCALWLAAAVV